MEGTTLAFLLTGLGVGLLSGLIGIGGATVLVPVLVLAFHFTQAKAQGTSVGALVPPIGLLAAIQYYRNGLLDVRAAALIAAGFVLGALGGATLVPHVPQLWLKRVFATVLVFLAAQLFFNEPGRRLGGVLPGAIGAAVMWLLYFARRAAGKDPPKPSARPPPPPDIDYSI